MNVVKKREKFRPFAPLVLEEFAGEYFDMGHIESSPYMQYVVPCKYPEKFPELFMLTERLVYKLLIKKCILMFINY